MSRARWVSRLLHYELPAEASHEPGLIMLQIDGLSREQFDRALARNRLPYLKKLLRGGHFQRAGFYSGVPASTPAVQAEIFYGKKSAVPSFSFRHRRTGRLIRMYEAESARLIGREIGADVDRPTLAGGSSYSNIYTGGAEEARFCAETMNLESVWTKGHPLKWLLIYAMYFIKFLRVISLGLVELLLAVVDFVQGLYQRRNFVKELTFIPARVGICVVLRELIQFMIRLDIERGVKIIHANFLGYDEQAHRRGPRSAFAHWTLKGIDRAIRDIHRAALRSEHRDYQLLVYSDHGQETVRTFRGPDGSSAVETVKSVVERNRLSFAAVNKSSRQRQNPLVHRSGSLLRSRQSHRERTWRADEGGPEEVVVTAMGPLGHLYLPRSLAHGIKVSIARDLVREAGIPLVLFVDPERRVRAIDARGEWRLPEHADKVVGADHPFREEVVKDLIAMCRRENAGDLVISGWSPGRAPLSFAKENGAHGGPGWRETHGFALIPEDYWPRSPKTDAGGEPYFRGLDLRRMVLRHVHPESAESLVEERHRRDSGRHIGDQGEGISTRLKVVTYNVHSCIGTDGKVRPQRISSLLRRLHPDVVALQEVDAHRPRTQHIHQTEVIASALGMDYVYLPLVTREEEQYGIAILSRHPFETVKASTFPRLKARSREPRGAIWIRLNGPSGPVHVVNTHFGLTRAERHEQLAALTDADWLGSLSAREPVVLCGDFNAGENSRICKRLRRLYRDVQMSVRDHTPRQTFVSLWPLLRLDHIFVSDHFQVRRVEVPNGYAPRLASDHLPLVAELELSAG